MPLRGCPIALPGARRIAETWVIEDPERLADARTRDLDEVDIDEPDDFPLSIPGLAHPLADEPGIEPAPQLPPAREVDAGLTAWFRRHLAMQAR